MPMPLAPARRSSSAFSKDASSFQTGIFRVVPVRRHSAALADVNAETMITAAMMTIRMVVLHNSDAPGEPYVRRGNHRLVLEHSRRRQASGEGERGHTRRGGAPPKQARSIEAEGSEPQGHFR